MRILNRFARNHGDKLYVVARVLVGLLFAMHGAQKVFGWFGGTKVASFASLLGVAGIIELVGGVFLAVGLLTRLVSFVAGIEMLVAYATVHMPQGASPLANQGELALLYFAAFALFFVKGAGKWTLEEKLKKK